jgi:hypothetical protein
MLDSAIIRAHQHAAGAIKKRATTAEALEKDCQLSEF